MKALSLFSGIGGLDLAAYLAGITTVAACEIDPFATQVLKQQMPSVPIYDDVRKISAKDFDGQNIDMIIGGYPCQPFSVAGKQRGQNDDRHLWPEMRRLVRELQPSWVVAENVKGHLTLGLDEVLSDLEDDGYCARPFCIPAVAVGAAHTRERLFIVANAASNGRYESQKPRSPCQAHDWATQGEDETLYLEGCSRVRTGVEIVSREAWGRGTQPGIRRVVDGLANRNDRIKAVGNAVCPPQAFPIFASIMEVDRMLPARASCR